MFEFIEFFLVHDFGFHFSVMNFFCPPVFKLALQRPYSQGINQPNRSFADSANITWFKG